MPYINQEAREYYKAFLDAHIQDLEEEGYQEGHVTYCVYKMVGHWFLNNPGYTAIADIRGMLAGVLSEFDRQFAFPYEDRKKRENGDVDFTLPPLEKACADPVCVKCDDAPVEFEPEEGDPDFDECECGWAPLGVHSTNLHKRGIK